MVSRSDGMLHLRYVPKVSSDASETSSRSNRVSVDTYQVLDDISEVSFHPNGIPSCGIF